MPTSQLPVVPLAQPPFPGLPAGPGYEEETSRGGMSLPEVIAMLRRHTRLVLACTVVFAALAAVMGSRSPIRYQATATIRLKDERKMMTAGLDNSALQAVGGPSFTVDPVLSQIQVLRSRSIMGRVVDSQGLRVTAPQAPGVLPVISGVEIPDEFLTDTLDLTFGTREVSARSSRGRGKAEYGKPLSTGGVTLTVQSHPHAEHARLVVVPRELTIDRMLGDLHAALRDKTDVVDLTYVAVDPRLAQRVLDAVVDTYQGFNADQAQQESRRRRVFIEEQLRQTDSLLNGAQLALVNFRRGQHAFSANARFADEQTGLAGLDDRRQELAANRDRYQRLLSRLGSGERQLPLQSMAGVAEVSASPVLAQLFAQQMHLMASRDSATGGAWGSTATNPDVQRLDRLIESGRSQLVSALQGQVSDADSRIQALDALRAQVLARMDALPPAAAEEGRLTQQAQTIQGVADQLRQELQRARISEAVEAGQVVVLDRAELPHQPLPRRRLLLLTFGLVVGLLVGGGAAFLMEQLNTSIRGREQLEQLLQLPVLAVVPRVGANGRKAVRSHSSAAAAQVGPGLVRAGVLLAAGETQNSGAEAYRTLRTNLIFSRSLAGMRTLVVTSGSPGEGKTTSAANLASVFASHGLRVLLVDCDLRRPSQHVLFGLPAEPGVSQVVLGYASFEDGLRETGVPGLSLMPAGISPPNPADLLASPAMLQLLAEARERFDLVMIDTPPVLFASDASILSAGADGVILMVRAGATQREAARSAYHQLAGVGARVLGTVLNDPDAVVPGYEGYYNGYYSGYHGYYGATTTES